ncbi:TonB-dependent receptor [Sphingobacterium sp. E70]|uniref:carboxypeptidase-like regulatory domain-containing protein n=1 Tax=Sphingobacterium sp. E70 TaxID=2853439 RepID=UPI00211C7FD8|nr:TonB-dependent receptor [Sphingobacterium sp. E70]ULT22169.1 TonB-dependent receptor [Sphingobacterium sp. E70]
MLLAGSYQTYAQVENPKPIINASLTGTVVDAVSKEPLQGVTVQIEAVTHQVKTDSKGVFQFVTGQKLPFSLIVSIVGYQTRRIIVDQSPTVIELTPRLEALDQVVVTARRRKEQLQDVPIPVSIIRGAALEDAGAFNVNRLKELVPTVQLYSSNARNTTLNIRGLGSTYGLTNDGIDPGVGFYLDGVYIARPAATWLDFIDIDQIEVLRGHRVHSLVKIPPLAPLILLHGYPNLHLRLMLKLVMAIRDLFRQRHPSPDRWLRI